MKINGVKVVTFCHIQNCFINTDPQSTQLSSDFLKITFRIWQNDYLNPPYFHMDANHISIWTKFPGRYGGRSRGGTIFIFTHKKYIKMILYVVCFDRM